MSIDSMHVYGVLVYIYIYSIPRVSIIKTVLGGLCIYIIIFRNLHF